MHYFNGLQQKEITIYKKVPKVDISNIEGLSVLTFSFLATKINFKNTIIYGIQVVHQENISCKPHKNCSY